MHIDLGSELAKILGYRAPPACLPQSQAADWLANEAKKQKEKGVKAPFPYADVSKFLAPWAVAPDEEPEEEGTPSISAALVIAPRASRYTDDASNPIAALAAAMKDKTPKVGTHMPCDHGVGADL